MGIVRRQSIISSGYIYIGFLVGALNVLVLYPRFTTEPEFGLTKVIVDVGMLIGMMCTMGSVPALIKFYPFYKNNLPEKENDLPTLAMLFCIMGTVLFCGISFFAKAYIVRKFGKESPLFVQYFYLIYPMIIAYGFFYMLEAVAWSVKKTIVTNFLKEVLFRVVTTILICLLAAKVIDYDTFIKLFSFSFFLPAAYLLYYLLKNKLICFNFSISRITKKMWKRIVYFSSFLFAGQSLNVLATTFTSIVIASQSTKGLADTAVYTICSYLVSLIDVPLRGVNGIATASLAQAWRGKDMRFITSLYKKTSLNLLIFGLAIFMVLFLNVHNLVAHFGGNYRAMPHLLLVLGITKLIDLGTGLNAQIMLSSHKWRMDFVTNIVLIIVSIPLNVYFVRRFGLEGVAYANLIAFSIFNIIRFIYIYVFFKLQPFGMGNVYTLLAGAGVMALTMLLPTVSNIYVDSVIRGVFFILLYFFIIVKSNISSDVNELLHRALVKVKLRQ